MGGTIFRFYGGDTAVMRGDIELMGGPPSPPTRENPGCRSFIVDTKMGFFGILKSFGFKTNFNDNTSHSF